MVMIPPVQTDEKQQLQDEITEWERVIAHMEDNATRRDLKPFEQEHLAAWKEALVQTQFQLANFDAVQADKAPQVPRPTWRKFMALWNNVDVWACLNCGTPTIVTPDIDLRDIHDKWCPNKPAKV